MMNYYGNNLASQGRRRAAHLSRCSKDQERVPNYDLMGKEAGARHTAAASADPEGSDGVGRPRVGDVRGRENGVDAYDLAFLNGRLRWRLLVDELVDHSWPDRGRRQIEHERAQHPCSSLRWLS